MANIMKMADDGLLRSAGPVVSQGTLSDIVVFRPGDFDAARKLMGEDPSVQSGALRIEAHHWWSAAHVLPWE